MIVWMFLGFVALTALLLVLSWLARADPARLGRALAALVVVLLVIIALLLLAVGRPSIAAPALVSALLLLWKMPGLARLFARGLGRGQGRDGRSRHSVVETGWLRLRLDLDSGVTEGEVLDGPFAGRRLADLGRDEFRRLRAMLSGDAESLQLLDAWVAREHSDWVREDHEEEETHHAPAAGGQEMSCEDALALLGLEEGAGAQEIRSAHRRLMRRLHPDHGGTSYLAAQLNRAKEILLDATQNGQE